MNPAENPDIAVGWASLVRLLGHRFRLSRNARGARNEEYERRWQCGCYSRSGNLAEGPQRYTACKSHRAGAARLT
jgi:hypothetical protein